MRLCFFAGFLLAGAVARAAGPVYDSPEGGFALTAPEGWEIKKEPGEPFPALFGPKDDVDAPLVVVNEVRGSADLLELGYATVKEMLKNPDYQLSVRDAFQTADKEFGVKYVLVTTKPAPYRQAFYFVQGAGGRMFAFIVTVRETGWKKYETDLDNMMRTFHLRPASPASEKAAPAASKTKPAPAPAKIK